MAAGSHLAGERRPNTATLFRDRSPSLCIGNSSLVEWEPVERFRHGSVPDALVPSSLPCSVSRFCGGFAAGVIRQGRLCTGHRADLSSQLLRLPWAVDADERAEA